MKQQRNKSEREYYVRADGQLSGYCRDCFKKLQKNNI